MATEGAAAQCPVCGEGFREAPARCFRCESDLELWWPLDESLRVLEGEVFPAFGARPSRAPGSGIRWVSRNAGWLVPVALLSGLAGALWLSLESTRPVAEAPRNDSLPKPPLRPAVAQAPSASAMSAAPSGPAQPSARRSVRYVVQPGDSLWRIAAALKGDARRWPELVANGDTVDPARLRPGQELRLVIEAAP